jgi:hypothetical protein
MVTCNTFHVVLVTLFVFLYSYRLRVEGLLIKEEFNANIEYIRPSIDSVIEAAKGKST